MNEAEILDYLTTQGIDYEYQRHPAVLTMDEAERLALPHPECEARNLFVRESRTHRYFLLTAHARVDLKAFSRQQGLRSLSFASADELREILWLEAGAIWTKLCWAAASRSTRTPTPPRCGCRRPISSTCFAHNACLWWSSPSPVCPDTSPILRKRRSAASCAPAFFAYC